MKQKFLTSGDLFEQISRGYAKIPVLYRRTFWWCYGVVNLVFAMHAVHFLFGNHEPTMAMYGISPSLYISQARFLFGIQMQITGGNFLPVLNNLLGFAFLIISSMLLCRLIRLPEKTVYWVSACLVPCLLPYITSWLYYPSALVIVTFPLVWIALAVFALNQKQNWMRVFCLAAVVFGVSAVYQTLLSTVGVFCICVFLLDVIDWDGSGLRGKALLRKYRMFFVAIAGGVLLYLLAFGVLKYFGLLADNAYMIQTEPLTPGTLPSRIFRSIYLGMRQFLVLSEYMNTFYRLGLLSLIVAGLTALGIEAEKRKNAGLFLIKGVLLILGLLGFFFCIELSSAVAFSWEESVGANRIAFFSVPFCCVFGYGMVLRFSNIIFRSAIMSLLLLLFWWGIVIDFHWQKTMFLSTQHALLSYNRVIGMMEQSPQFHPGINRDLILLGTVPNEREKFKFRTLLHPVNSGGWDLSEKLLKALGFTALIFPAVDREFHWDLTAQWAGSDVFKYLAGNTIPIRRALQLEGVANSAELEAFLNGYNGAAIRRFLLRAEAYPAPAERCFYVDDQCMILILESEPLRKIQAFESLRVPASEEKRK